MKTFLSHYLGSARASRAGFGAPPKRAIFIYAHSDLSVNLRGAAAASAKVNMVELNRNNKACTGRLRLHGDREMDGWIATAQENGKTFQVRASSPALLDVAQGKSQDSLNAMITDYEKRLQP